MIEDSFSRFMKRRNQQPAETPMIFMPTDTYQHIIDSIIGNGQYYNFDYEYMLAVLDHGEDF
jgi:hypothetical protein